MAWVRALAEQAADFARTGGLLQPIVRVTLSDGERFFLAHADPRTGTRSLVGFRPLAWRAR